MTLDKTILLTIDVEDWFHVENFRPWFSPETWDQCELRVERNTHRLLDLFDSFESAGKPEAGSRKAETEKSKNRIQHPSFIASQPPTRNDELNRHGQRTTDNGHTKKVIEGLRPGRIESDHFHPESDPNKKFMSILPASA